LTNEQRLLKFSASGKKRKAADRFNSLWWGYKRRRVGFHFSPCDLIPKAASLCALVMQYSWQF